MERLRMPFNRQVEYANPATAPAAEALAAGLVG